MGKPGTAVPGVRCQEKESRRDGTSAAREGDTQPSLAGLGTIPRKLPGIFMPVFPIPPF